MSSKSRWYGRVLAISTSGVVVAAVLAPAGPASAAGVPGTTPAPTASMSFTAVGEHAFKVPPGVTRLHVVAVGGRGGSGYSPGGLGARAEGDVRVTPGSTVYAEVGGDGAAATQVPRQPAPGGANGGQSGGAWTGTGWLSTYLSAPPASGAGGGGASDVQTCSVANCQPIDVGSPALLLVAGGGGGGGADSIGGTGGTPVGGDATVGTDGSAARFEFGLGATDTAAGTNWGAYANDGPKPHCVGDTGDSFGAGGGGGGYYCGGGGGSTFLGGGGGGGSSFGPSGTTYAPTTQAPSVTITYSTGFRLAPASRSSLALDVVGGQVVQQTPTGSVSQEWRLVPRGSLYQIVNQASSQCVTTDGVAGHGLFMSTCDPMAQNLWQVPAGFGASTSGSMIWNPTFNVFMEVFGGSTSAGGVIDAWPYNGGNANQYFLSFPF